MSFLSHLSTPVLATIAGVLGLLLLVSLLVRVVMRVPASSELWLRIRSWWAMVGVLVAALLIGRGAMIALLGFISYLALKEYFSVIPTRRADRGVLFACYLTVPIQYAFVADGWYGMFIIFIPVYAFLFIPAMMVVYGETQGFLKASGTLHWGLMTTVFAVSHAAFLLAVPLPGAGSSAGPGLLLFLLILTEINDVAQYVSGKSFGRYKISPKVSPKKTLAGLIGGVAVTFAVAMALFGVLTPLSWPHAVAVGLVLPLAGFIGDITMSAVKRDLGIKDAGALIPGHGGILDRIDSLTFTAPLFFHFVRYFYGA